MSKRLTAAAVERLRPGTARLEIADAGSEGLRLVIQPSGAKSWAMRFRRPDGKNAKLTLGSVDLSGREGREAPRIGQPLTLREARLVASDVHRRRASGIDVVAEHGRRGEVGDDAFSAVAADFIRDHTGKRTWRDVARILGLAYADGSVDPTVVPGSLADRWERRPIGSITTADVHAVIAECIGHGVPGMGRKAEGRSESRGRKMASALGALFRWTSQHRRHAIQVNPTTGVWRPGPPASRHRTLNTRPEVRRADEARWLWRATEEMGHPFGGLIRLLLLTGARRDKLADLRHEEVADDLSAIHLSGSRTKKAVHTLYTLSPLAREVLASVPRVEGCRGSSPRTAGSPSRASARRRRRSTGSCSGSPRRRASIASSPGASTTCEGRAPRGCRRWESCHTSWRPASATCPGPRAASQVSTITPSTSRRGGRPWRGGPTGSRPWSPRTWSPFRGARTGPGGLPRCPWLVG